MEKFLPGRERKYTEARDDFALISLTNILRHFNIIRIHVVY